ncbi:MAG: hypothetical protein QOI49_1561 [Verrucomicrobiota bacterium]
MGEKALAHQNGQCHFCEEERMKTSFRALSEKVRIRAEDDQCQDGWKHSVGASQHSKHR